MHRWNGVCVSALAAAAVLVASPVLSAGAGLKPGLWETRVTKQLVDGRDMISRMPAAGAQVCISAEQAKSDKPVLDRQARCEPASSKRSGNRTTFEMNCTVNGIKTTGKGESTATGDAVTTVLDMNSQMNNGLAHVTHTETVMKFLRADCGSVRPLVVPNTPDPKPGSAKTKTK